MLVFWWGGGGRRELEELEASNDIRVEVQAPEICKGRSLDHPDETARRHALHAHISLGLHVPPLRCAAGFRLPEPMSVATNHRPGTLDEGGTVVVAEGMSTSMFSDRERHFRRYAEAPPLPQLPQSSQQGAWVVEQCGTSGRKKNGAVGNGGFRGCISARSRASRPGMDKAKQCRQCSPMLSRS